MSGVKTSPFRPVETTPPAMKREYALGAKHGWDEAIKAAAEEAKSWGRLKLAAAIRKLRKE